MKYKVIEICRKRQNLIFLSVKKMWQTRLILDRHQYFYTIKIKPSKNTKQKLGLSCITLCGANLTRPHLTCLWCRVRRMWYKKMPNKIPIDVIIVTVNKQQKNAKLKAAVRKFLFTLAGWTLN